MTGEQNAKQHSGIRKAQTVRGIPVREDAGGRDVCRKDSPPEFQEREKMEDIIKAVFGFCGFVGVMCLIVALFSLPTMWLINGLLAPGQDSRW